MQRLNAHADGKVIGAAPDAGFVQRHKRVMLDRLLNGRLQFGSQPLAGHGDEAVGQLAAGKLQVIIDRSVQVTHL